jgi:hypothetical protein
VVSLLMVTLRSSDAVSGSSRTSVQWHWETHVNPRSPGLYWHRSFTNKGGRGRGRVSWQTLDRGGDSCNANAAKESYQRPMALGDSCKS